MSTTLRNFCVYVLSACLSPFIAFLFRSCCVIYCLPISPLFRGTPRLNDARTQRAKRKEYHWPTNRAIKVWNWNMGHFEALFLSLVHFMPCGHNAMLPIFLSSCNKREVQRVENSHRITLKLLLLFLMCINFSETLGGKLNCQ